MDTFISYQYTFIIIVAHMAFVALFGRWAWQDARERGLSRMASILVLLLVFTIIPIGLGLWLLFRPDNKDSMRPFGIPVAKIKKQNKPAHPTAGNVLL